LIVGWLIVDNDSAVDINSITSTLTINKAESSHSGVYYCEATSSQSGIDAVNSDAVNVIVLGE